MNRHIPFKPLLPILILITLLFPARAIARPLPPASSRPQRQAAVAKAITWLHGQFQSGDIHGLSTCEVARVVALTGGDPDGSDWAREASTLLAQCEDAFRDLQRTDVGEAAKAARAAIAAGRDPRHFAGTDLIAFIESQYNPDTGYYHPYNLFRNDLAIIALSEAGRAIPADAVAALTAAQNPDGCWGWPIDPNATASDTDTSGMTLYAFAAAGQPNARAASQCISRLRAMQNDDGGWELSGIYGDQVSNADSTALVIQGLTALGWDPEGPLFTRDQTAVQALLSFQADDGAFWWRHEQQGTLLLGTIQSIQPLVMTYPNEIPKPIPLYLPLSMR